MLHYTAMRDAQAAQARLCDPAAEVSAHWLVACDGAVTALVPENLRAWHAGAGEWGGRGDVNSRSIGVEIDNPGDRPFASLQMVALEGLLRGILARWQIPPQGVIAHSDLAPGRKRDPGARFDWQGLARAGLSVWPTAGLAPPDSLAESLTRIGYPLVPWEARLAAFRLRFRPGACGAVTAAEAGAAADLARRYPVDALPPGA